MKNSIYGLSLHKKQPVNVSNDMLRYIFKAPDIDEFNRRIYCFAVYLNKKGNWNLSVKRGESNER